MPGQHDMHKHQIAVKFPHRVWRQIEKAAEKKDMTPGEYIRYVVTEAVDSVELMPNDIRLIADRIEEALKKGKMV